VPVVKKSEGKNLEERLHLLTKSFDELIAEPIDTTTEAFKKYITFSLGQECFALLLSDIKEILVNQRIIPVPVQDSAIHGVVNYKNEILPVINLHHLLGLISTEAGKTNALLLTRGLPAEAALLAEEIVAILAIPDDAIKPKPICLDQNCEKMIVGEFYHQGRLITLLDIMSITDSSDNEALIR